MLVIQQMQTSGCVDGIATVAWTKHDAQRRQRAERRETADWPFRWRSSGDMPREHCDLRGDSKGSPRVLDGKDVDGQSPDGAIKEANVKVRTLWYDSERGLRRSVLGDPDTLACLVQRADRDPKTCFRRVAAPFRQESDVDVVWARRQRNTRVTILKKENTRNISKPSCCHTPRT